MSKPETMMIDDVKYIREDKAAAPAKNLDGLEYVICRSLSAGVFAGYIESRIGQEVVMLQARRLWYWSGASSLSQAALDGFSRPQNCKFPAEVPRIYLLQVFEIIPCSRKAQDSIASVAIWKQ